MNIVQVEVSCTKCKYKINQDIDMSIQTNSIYCPACDHIFDFNLNDNNDLDNNLTKNIKIERPFFSTYTRLAAGIALEDRFYRDSLPDLNNDFEFQDFKNRTTSFWLGHSFKIFKGNNENNMSTNFVTTIGLRKINYFKTPIIDYDPSRFFASENLYLTSIGLTTRKFVQDKYLFNFGII